MCMICEHEEKLKFRNLQVLTHEDAFTRGAAGGVENVYDHSRQKPSFGKRIEALDHNQSK